MEKYVENGDDVHIYNFDADTQYIYRYKCIF